MPIPPELRVKLLSHPGSYTCEYSGSGDSGSVERCYRRDTAPGEVRLSSDLIDALVAATEATLEDQFPGWEISEGSSGVVTITVEPPQLRYDICHDAPVIETEFANGVL